MTRRLVCVLLAALLAVAAAGCGGSSKPSPQDTAKTNGEAVGKATKQLVNSRSIADVEKAVPELQQALKDVQANVKDSGGTIQSQIKAQEQAITTAFNALKSAAGSGDIPAATTAIDQLQSSLTSIGTQAKTLASTSDSVAKAFWEGVQSGYDDG